MIMTSLLGALAGAAAPSAIPAAPPKIAVHAVPVVTPKPSKPDFAQILALFDKLFPAGPAPDPARLVLARTTVETLWPNGTYGRLMEQVMGGFYERMMTMKVSDFDKASPGKAKPPSDLTIHQSLIKGDPLFDQRAALIRTALTDEMKTLSGIVEPRLRDGLAKAAARRFDVRQLTDINAFFATDSGRALGSNLMTIWADPDTMRGLMQSMPDLVAAMPGIMARVEKATASLPKPKNNVAVPPAPKPKP